MTKLVLQRARRLMRRPRLVLPGVASLALGCAGVLLLLTLIQGVLLKPLPFADGDALYHVGWRFQAAQPLGTGHTADMARHIVSDIHGFSAAGRYSELGSGYAVGGLEGTARSIPGMRADAGFLATLGAEPVMGRNFSSDEVRRQAQVVVLGAGLARTLAAENDPIGATVTIDGLPHRVIGVLPDTFWFQPNVQLILPLATGGIGDQGHNTSVVARLAAGVSAAAALDELLALNENVGSGAGQPPFSDRPGAGMMLMPLKEHLVANTRQPLSLLLGAVALLLVLACFNVANLVLAEAAAARGEAAVELALGARQRRLVLYRLVDCGLLVAGGLALGLLLTWLLLPPVLAMAAPIGLPRLEQVRIGATTLAWLLAVGVVATALSALLALIGQRPINLAFTLRSTAAGRGGERLPWRRLLVVGQITISIMLLVLAGLIAASVQRLADTDLGIAMDDVISVQFSLADAAYRGDQAARATADLVRSLTETLEALPGVNSVTAASSLPLIGGLNNWVERPGIGFGASVEVRIVSPRYFETLGIPVVRGRGLDGGDRAGAERVMVVNEAFARLAFETDPAVDGTLQMEGYDWRIAGVVADQRDVSLREGTYSTVFLTYEQASDPLMQAVNRWFPQALMIRGPGAHAAGSELRDTLARVAPEVPVLQIRPLRQVVQSQLMIERFILLLLSVFGLCALLLSCAGLFGLLEFERVRRRHELAVRVALGASAARVFTSLTRQGMIWSVAGLALGGLLSIPAVRLLEELLHEPGLADLGLVLAILAFSGLLMTIATLLSGLRGMGIHPVEALRHE